MADQQAHTHDPADPVATGLVQLMTAMQALYNRHSRKTGLMAQHADIDQARTELLEFRAPLVERSRRESTLITGTVKVMDASGMPLAQYRLRRPGRRRRYRDTGLKRQPQQTRPAGVPRP
jgi:hypothetical protein